MMLMFIYRNRCLPLLLLVLLIGTGCATVQVSQDYDTSRIFPALRSYSWKNAAVAETGDERVSNPLLHSRFHQAIERNLAAKGYIENQIPDFYLTYDFSIRTRLESDPVSPGFGTGTYRGHWGFGVSSGSEIRQYDQGILIIDIYDRDNRTLLWRGRGSQRYNAHLTPQQSTKMANEMVAAILAQFPPR